MVSGSKTQVGVHGQSSAVTSKPSAQKLLIGKSSPAQLQPKTALFRLNPLCLLDTDCRFSHLHRFLDDRLKDSDVTWLYGPLHEHVESVPPPKLATTADRLNLDDGHRVRSILKHRTISDMLTTSGSAASPNIELETNPIDDHMAEQDRKAEEQKRKPLFTVKSDSNLFGKTPKRTGGSPNAMPLVSAQKKNSPSIGRADSAASDEKRHISFNHRVEQCIALDHQYPNYDDYEEDEFEEEDDPSSEEEEVLTMKSSPRTSPSISHASSSSKHLDHQATIAKLAPTRLKTSEVYPAPSPAVVDPTGFLATRVINGSTVSTYPIQYGYARAGVPPVHGDPTARGVQWDLEDDFNGDFDYFDGPDLADGAGDHLNSNGPVFNTGDAASSPDASRTYGSYFDHSESDRTDGSTSSTSPQDLAAAALEQSQASVAPRGILKHRIIHQNATQDYEPRSLEAEGDYDLLGSSHQQESSSFAESYEPARNSSDDSRERGRPSQRLGSSASYERVQEAARQGRGRTNSGASSGHSPTNSTVNGGSSYDKCSSSSSSTSPASVSASPDTARSNARSSVGGSESFRTGKDDPRDAGADGLRAGDSTTYGGKARSVANRSLNDYDSDGQEFYGLGSPHLPASPHLDAKDDEGSNRSSQDRDGDRYMYGDERNYWSDDRKESKRGAKSQPPNAAATELSVNVECIPNNARPASKVSASVTSPDGPVEVGPTPLNTPTFILARASGKRRSSSGSGADIRGGGPFSPTLPRRTSATGALVAPHNSEPRVPLAHDYVEEDEGGIIGRAVEIVNTARDLIGALLGTGDRGRSWREG